MKKIKLFSIVAAFVAAFAFTSCNTGDDNNSYYQPLTQAEKQTCYLKTSGSRMSQLAYVSDEHVTEKDGKKEYHDTIKDVSTSIHGDGKDTVMTVKNFPVKIFARYIPENVDTKGLKEALKKYNKMPVSFKSVVYYYTITPVIQFMLFPDAITVNLEYGGATHKVKFYCYSSGNSRYTFGQVTQDKSDKSKVEAYLVVYGYEVDPKDEKKPNPTAFNFNMAGTQLANGTQIKFFEP